MKPGASAGARVDGRDKRGHDGKVGLSGQIGRSNRYRYKSLIRGALNSRRAAQQAPLRQRRPERRAGPSVDRAAIIASRLEPRLKLPDGFGRPDLRFSGEFGSRFARVRRDRVQKVVRGGGRVFSHPAPFVEQHGRGAVALRIALRRGAPEEGERFARRLAADPIRDERGEVVGRAGRAVVGGLPEKIKRARNVNVDPLALDKRDGEVERAVGAAALSRFLIERIGRLEVLWRVIARLEQKTETDHGPDVVGFRGLAIKPDGFIVAAGGEGGAGEQSLVVRDLRVGRRGLAADLDGGLRVLLKRLHFDAIDAGGGVVGMGREALAGQFRRR